MRKLAGEYGGSFAITAFSNFEDVPAFFQGVGFQADVIQNQQFNPLQLFYEFTIPVFCFSVLKLKEKLWNPAIFYRVAFATGVVSKGTGQEGLP